MGCEAGGGRELGDRASKLSLTILFISMTEAVGCPPHTPGDPGYTPQKAGGGYGSPGGAMLLAGNGGPVGGRRHRGWTEDGRGGAQREGDGRGGEGRGRALAGEVLLRGGPGKPRDLPQEVRTPRDGFRDPEVPGSSSRRV